MPDRVMLGGVVRDSRSGYAIRDGQGVLFVFDGVTRDGGAMMSSILGVGGSSSQNGFLAGWLLVSVGVYRLKRSNVDRAAG